MRLDTIYDWKLVLRTGFGNIFDVGHGWDYEAGCMVAEAITNDDWREVEAFARTKALSPMAS